MKMLSMALVGSSLLLCSAALADYKAPEGNGNVTYATNAAPEGNTNVTFASYAAPEGNGNVTYASYAAPEGNGNFTYASYAAPEGNGNVTYASYAAPEGNGNVELANYVSGSDDEPLWRYGARQAPVVTGRSVGVDHTSRSYPAAPDDAPFAPQGGPQTE